MSIDGKRYLAATAFLGLLLLSLFWPAPVVSVNRLCCGVPLPVDDLSFLGREAPSWDVLFWCLAGLFTMALVQSGLAASERGEPGSPRPADGFREAWALLRALRFRAPARAVTLAAAVAALLVAVVWRYLDRPGVAWAEAVQSDGVEDGIRLLNRLGGGMNPLLIVGFFLIAGAVFSHRRWIEIAVAMAVAGLAAGILAQVIKVAVGRTRPELWLGPFQHARSAATSFPSGHTIGAFALGGVLLFASRSWPLRIAALLLAAAIGLSRVLAFRHWPSDVVASAALGLLAAWVVTAGVTAVTPGGRSAP
ncbi:MAG: phosphoesterase [Acidobacteria bacterium]|nr:phosphoesterase [Acidobacteriota bacterium]